MGQKESNERQVFQYHKQYSGNVEKSEWCREKLGIHDNYGVEG
jgi:hypothetical protein